MSVLGAAPGSLRPISARADMSLLAFGSGSAWPAKARRSTSRHRAISREVAAFVVTPVVSDPLAADLLPHRSGGLVPIRGVLF
jgi:hypothetical protein